MVTLADLKEALKLFIYGSQGAQLQQKAGTHELLVEDTGLRKALREELDIHSSYGSTKMLAFGVDAYFVSQAVLPGVLSSFLKTSEAWKQLSSLTDSDGEYKCPATHISIGTFSKRAYSHPHVDFKTKLPTLSKAGQQVYLGVELDAAIGTGIAAFWYVYGLPEVLIALVGTGASDIGVVITAALPVDYKTARHHYSIIVTKSQVEFYIDYALVAVAINSSNLAFTAVAYPPYGIFHALSPFTTSMASLISCRGNANELILPLAPSNVWLGDGEPSPSRVYRLYQTGTSTLFAGSVIAAGSLTSHPVPTFGFDGKTIHFQANQAGTLLVEVLTQTNNWRTYDTVITVANALESYTIAAEAVLARVTFTPSAYPCTIADAEAVLR